MSEDQVNRGSSWDNSAQYARVAFRNWDDPTLRNLDLGFRLVSDGADRVGRGGSWIYSALVASVADRVRGDPAGRFNSLGFRLAREGT